MYIYVYTYVCTYVYMCIHAYIYVYIHIYIFIYMYIYLCIYVCMYIYIYMCMCSYVICIYIYMREFAYVRVCVCERERVCLYRRQHNRVWFDWQIIGDSNPYGELRPNGPRQMVVCLGNSATQLLDRAALYLYKEHFVVLALCYQHFLKPSLASVLFVLTFEGTSGKRMSHF